MELTSKLDNAIGLAWQIHYGQKDKGGEAYILHVMRVVENVRRRGFEENFLIAAALHDVIEDGKVWATEVQDKFGEDVADAVVLLTRREKESYDKYIDRVNGNHIARVVKIADIEDHLERPNAEKFPKYKQYLRAKSLLEGLPSKEGTGRVQVLL